MSNAKRVIKVIAILIATALYLVSMTTVVLPYLSSKNKDKSSKTTASEFITDITSIHQKYSAITATGSLEDMAEIKDLPYAELLSTMREYNEDIYLNHQSNLVDAWTYTTSSGFDLKEYGIENEIVGTIDVPKIGTFPIYLGATYEHMNVGMAQLGQTSMPIGGNNTNCVICGHRGWSNGEYLKNIEEVEIGDIVTVNNLWYEMKYEVSDIQVIEPDDIERVLIQPGKDLLTLVTCHPYGSGGRYRYLLICSRIDTIPVIEETTAPPQRQSIEKPIVIESDIDFESSKQTILLDEWLHILSVGLGIAYPLLLIGLGIKRIMRAKRKKKAG